MAGITSPARDWFRLTTPDPELAEFGAVKEWLFVVESRLRLAFQRSNLYQSCRSSTRTSAGRAPAVMHVEEDVEDGCAPTSFRWASTAWPTPPRLRVDTVYPRIWDDGAAAGAEVQPREVQRHGAGRLPQWQLRRLDSGVPRHAAQPRPGCAGAWAPKREALALLLLRARHQAGRTTSFSGRRATMSSPPCARGGRSPERTSTEAPRRWTRWAMSAPCQALERDGRRGLRQNCQPAHARARLMIPGRQPAPRGLNYLDAANARDAFSPRWRFTPSHRRRGTQAARARAAHPKRPSSRTSG
jgi:hypothetical protein